MVPIQNRSPITHTIKKHEKSVIHMPNGCPIILNTSYPLAKFIAETTAMSTSKSDETWDLTKYENRLITFKSGWKLEFLKPELMAKAGFYYMGRQDRVRCPFCSIEIDYWQPNDEPHLEHVKLSPNCRYVIGKHGYDVCGDYSINEMNQLEETQRIQKFLGSIGIVQQIKAPRHKEFASLDTRLTTFSKCMIKLKQSIHILSEAGLFYIGDGYNDQMLCFCCSRGLKDWEDDDEPWTEHARWSPNCSYVLLCKGKSFVEKACGFTSSYQTLCSADHIDPRTAVSILEKNFKLTKMYLAQRNLSEPVQKKFNYQIAMSQLNTRLALKNQPLIQQQQEYSGPVPDCLICKICFKEEIRVAFIPCGHAIACIQCALTLDQCAVCRQEFSMAMRIDIHKTIEYNVQIPESSTRYPEKAENHIFCKVCHTEEMSAAFIPCRHVYACVKCATEMDLCPMCREPVCATIQVYL